MEERLPAGELVAVRNGMFWPTDADLQRHAAVDFPRPRRASAFTRRLRYVQAPARGRIRRVASQDRMKTSLSLLALPGLVAAFVVAMPELHAQTPTAARAAQRLIEATAPAQRPELLLPFTACLACPRGRLCCRHA